MSLEELIESMKEEFGTAINEADKFSAGNKSAGTRVRKHMQKLKGLAQNVRTEIQDMKNNS